MKKDKKIEARVSFREKEIIRQISRDKKISITDVIIESIKKNYPEYFRD